MFYDPTLEKLKERIALGLSVRPSVYPFKIYQDTVLKFHIWTPHQKKYLTRIYLKSELSPFVELYPF